MTTPASKRPLELPPEAEPARAFIEALVERFETRIRELERQIEKLTLTTRLCRLALSILMPSQNASRFLRRTSESLADKKGTREAFDRSFLRSNATP